MVLSDPSRCDGKLSFANQANCKANSKYKHCHYHVVETSITVNNGGVKIFCKKNL